MRALYYFLCTIFIYSFISCSGNKEVKEDILVGELRVSVDASILPIFMEQKEVFESSYPDALIVPEVHSEVSAINNLLAGNTSFALLTRELSDAESVVFKQKSISPRIFPVGYDAIVAISNISTRDTSITSGEIKDLLVGRKSIDATLVFDDLNSSIFRYFKDLTAGDKIVNSNVEVADSVVGVLNAILSSDSKIGFISFNQYLSLKRSFSKIDKIRILSVLNDSLETPKYVLPSQASLSLGEYPFMRTIYALNYQPKYGLGIGFSSFMSGDRGQRIVLKSGLLPATMPGREIIIRDGFN